MNLPRVGIAILFATSAVTIGLMQACSSNTGTADAGASSSTAHWPERPSGPTVTGTEVHNYALRKLYLGDNSTWKKYGFDLDNKKSTKDSTDVCKPAAGAPKTNQEDGDNGVDNSFGRNVMPIVSNLRSSAQTEVNAALEDGKFTIMVVTKGWTPSDSAFTGTGVSAKLYAGGKFSDTVKPTWTTADDWPVTPSLLTDPTNVDSAKIVLSEAYAVKGTFVSGSPTKVSVSLSFGGTDLALDIEQAIITMDIKGTSATNGRIAGVINAAKLIDGLRQLGGRFSKSLCTGSTFDSIADQIRQAADMMVGGTNAAGADCDAISVGLAFEATEIGAPKRVAAPAATEPDPCAGDAGTDAGDAGDAGK